MRLFLAYLVLQNIIIITEYVLFISNILTSIIRNFIPCELLQKGDTTDLGNKNNARVLCYY